MTFAKDFGENIPRKKSQRTTRAKRKSPSTVTSNRGNWLRHFPEAAADLHEYVLTKWFSGDKERLSSGDGLFRRCVVEDVEAWFYQKYLHICEFYQTTYHRRLNGGHIVRRVRFMYVQYKENGKCKIDGVRSREYRDVIR